MGIGGAYNYGCEAIIRGTVAMLRSAWPDISILYRSFRPDDDRKRLAGCILDIVERKVSSRYSIKRIARRVASALSLQWSPALDSLSQLEGVNAVLSIGGDLYTLQPDGSFNTSLPKFGNSSEKKGVPYILWGASIGPFSRNQKAERFFAKHLSRISLITAREMDSVDYLSRIGITSNVVPCADPAFLVAPEIMKSSEKGTLPIKTIGINISPLSLKYIYMTADQAADSQSAMIEHIIERTKARVLLLPHVVCDFAEGDDDLRWLKRIKNNLASRYSKCVDLVDHDPGFLGLKKILTQCDLLIAARMHCAVNALAACIPTLFLAYSQKAYGMSEYIYGHRSWVLPLAEVSSEKGFDKLTEMMRNLSEIHEFLKCRMPQVRSDAKRPIEALKMLLEKTWSI